MGEPRSFGRRDEPKEQFPVVMIPPLRMSEIQLPLVLVVDSQSLETAAKQIEAMVKNAVLSGFNLAMDEVAAQDPDAMAADELGFPGQPRTT